MSNSIRFAVIGLMGALMMPSLCSAQLIILHENWHGLGASKFAISEVPSSSATRYETTGQTSFPGTKDRESHDGAWVFACTRRRASRSFIADGASRQRIFKLLQQVISS